MAAAQPRPVPPLPLLPPSSSASCPLLPPSSPSLAGFPPSPRGAREGNQPPQRRLAAAAEGGASLLADKPDPDPNPDPNSNPNLTLTVTLTLTRRWQPGLFTPTLTLALF